MGWLFFPKLRSDYHHFPHENCHVGLPQGDQRSAIHVWSTYNKTHTFFLVLQEYYYILYITVFPTKFYISRYILDIPPEKTLNLQCHTANINTQVLKDPCFDPAPQRIGLERSKNGAVDCAISALLRRLSENGLAPEKPSSFTCKKPMGFPILPILPWPSLAQPVSIGCQSASSMPRKVSWFHSESRRTLRRAPGVRGTRIPTWRHSKRI